MYRYFFVFLLASANSFSDIIGIRKDIPVTDAELDKLLLVLDKRMDSQWHLIEIIEYEWGTYRPTEYSFSGESLESLAGFLHEEVQWRANNKIALVCLEKEASSLSCENELKIKIKKVDQQWYSLDE